MFKNYVTVALRNLVKHKGYSFINIVGLALGLACCVFMLLYVQDERSYDRFHEKAGRIHRVAFNGQAPDASPDRFATVSRPVARVLRSDYPEAEAVVRLSPWNPAVKHQGQYFYDDEVLIAEPTFFDLFSFPLIEGDLATALEAPYTLVLTESAAAKYFGDGTAVGQNLTLDDTLSFTVTGVTADVPANSHFTYDLLVSYETWRQFNGTEAEENAWLNMNIYTYVLLREGVDPAAFEAKIAGMIETHFAEVLRTINLKTDLVLEPLTEIYLRSDRGAQLGPTGDVTYVYLFSAIALFVLLIACINFMNLATARSVERAKEVGVRKVVGSTRGMLIRQFLSESVVLCGIALVVAVAMILAALPAFNELAGKTIGYATLLEPQYVLGLLGIALVAGLLAGSYPAFALSSFPTIDVLKGAFKTSARGVWLRRSLVVVQFAISVALIVSTAVVLDQLRYMRAQDLGFAKDQILVVDTQGLPGATVARQYETAKAEFERHPGVREAAASAHVPGRGSWALIVFPEGIPEGDSRRMDVVPVDHDYADTYGLEIVAGRDFDPAFETDRPEGVLVNEAAVAHAGWGTPEEAIGKHITFGGNQWQGTVVGVIADYHHASLKQRVEPLLLRIIPQTFNYVSLRIDTEQAPDVLAHLETTWADLFPGYAFDAFFLDTDFDTQYRAEQRLMEVVGVFSTLAIVIACLGLFGLAAFTTAQRTKEIGVRKVLGASVPSIILLLTKEFVRLVGVAFLVAAPAAYVAMRAWLQQFPYHTDIGPGIFVAAGLAALAIAFATVSYQSIRAATVNPVRSLRYE